MSRLISSLVVLVLVAACAKNEARSATRDTSAWPVREVPGADSAPLGATGARRPETWTVTPSGFGPIEAGMSIAELRRVTGESVLAVDTLSDCAYLRPSSLPPGVGVMLVSGQVARIDVDSAGVRTEMGAGIGDTERRVSQLYAGRVTTTPHKYLTDGRYLVVAPMSAAADTIHRMVFETEANRVTRFRAGRRPEVEWVERCG